MLHQSQEFQVRWLTFFLATSFVMAMGTQGHAQQVDTHHAQKSSGQRVPARPAHTSEFRGYPQRTRPNLPPNHPMASRPPFNAVPVHRDSLGNHVTNDHLNRIEFAHQRESTLMKSDPHVNQVVAERRVEYVNQLRPVYQKRTVIFNQHFQTFNLAYSAHPMYWNTWHSHHFWGGYYYGFHPCPEIHTYFYNPVVHWFFIGTWDDPYYHTWYRDEYVAYPQLNHPFPYYGVYYPTENLRELLFGVSGMPVDKQAYFRTGITNFTQILTQQLANVLAEPVHLTNGDIVVTHYEILGYDNAVVLDGIINFLGRAYNFKGLVDLDTPQQEQVFIALSPDQPPSPDQLRNLDVMNATIDRIRGETFAN